MEVSEFLTLPEEKQKELLSAYRNQASIRERYEWIQREQNDLVESLGRLQEACLHPNASVTHRADTGNYSKSDDCYWTEHLCPDCGKFWREDK